MGETSPSTYNATLNRAINKLQIILDNRNTIPEAEKMLIVYITQKWKETLEAVI